MRLGLRRFLRGFRGVGDGRLRVGGGGGGGGGVFLVRSGSLRGGFLRRLSRHPVGRGLGLERDGGGEALGGGALEPRVDVVVGVVAGFEVVEVRGAELPSVAAREGRGRGCRAGAGGRVSGGSGEGTRREAREGSGNGGCSASRGWAARPRAPLLHLERHGGRVTAGMPRRAVAATTLCCVSIGRLASRPTRRDARAADTPERAPSRARATPRRATSACRRGRRARACAPPPRRGLARVFNFDVFKFEVRLAGFSEGNVGKMLATVCRRFKIPDRSARGSVFFFPSSSSSQIAIDRARRRETRGERVRGSSIFEVV